MTQDFATGILLTMFVGAAPGALLGWAIVARGAKTAYFQGLAQEAASSGISRSQFVGLLALRTAAYCGGTAAFTYAIVTWL